MRASFNEFINTISGIDDKKEVADFLSGILTMQEQAELAVRLKIVKKLIAKEPQAKIAKELGVGIATVTRGSKEIKAGRFKALRRDSK